MEPLAVPSSALRRAPPARPRGARTSACTAGGAAHRPDVSRLPAGSRVTDAVRRAGGFARGASRDAINLAARLSDGQQVVVPRPGSSSAPAGGAQDGPVSLG